MRYIKIIFFSFLLPLVAFAKPIKTEELNIQLPNIKVYAFEKVLDRWGSEQWDFLDKLVNKESRWNHKAQNPKSSAFGIGQFINSTWGTVNCEKTSDPYIQVSCMLDYIELRYKTPQKALEFHLKKNWY
jgi:hypothetical protein